MSDPEAGRRSAHHLAVAKSDNLRHQYALKYLVGCWWGGRVRLSDTDSLTFDPIGQLCGEEKTCRIWTSLFSNLFILDTATSVIFRVYK